MYHPFRRFLCRFSDAYARALRFRFWHCTGWIWMLECWRFSYCATKYCTAAFSTSACLHQPVRVSEKKNFLYVFRRKLHSSFSRVLKWFQIFVFSFHFLLINPCQIWKYFDCLHLTEQGRAETNRNKRMQKNRRKELFVRVRYFYLFHVNHYKSWWENHSNCQLA